MNYDIRPASNSKLSANGSGFSLVEMLIALLFTSLLMAGMLRLYASSTAGFSSARESITAQRENRWAIGMLDDDLSQAGMYFPLGHLPADIGKLSVSAGAQNPIMVLPNQSVSFLTTSPDGTSPTETVKFDEIQFITDLAIPVDGKLATATIAGGTTVSVTVDSGSLSHLKAGDWMFFMDPGGVKDSQMVGSVSGNVVTIVSGMSGSSLGAGISDTNAGSTTNPAFPGTLQTNHKQDAPVLFIRPDMVVRYSIQAEALDPSDAAHKVPCLIREVAPYPTTGSLLDWTSISGSPAYQRDRVMTHASGLRVDMSLDGGRTWSRSGATGTGTVGWGQMVTALNAQISSNTYPYNSISGAKADWYRSIPVLFRLDVQTRSSNLRAENSSTGTTLAYKTRTQTLLVSPRNFSMERFK